MKTSSGFTVVEILVLFLFLSVLGAVIYDRYQVLETIHRDKDRKVAINAMYYNLEEVVRPSLNGYPRVLTANTLKAMDKALFLDPSGIRVDDPLSDYRYEPTGCNGGDVCRGYTLRADLERENDFVRTSPGS